MSRSFFTFTNDTALLLSSKGFSEAISLSPETYGLDAALAAEYAARHAVFAETLKAIGNRNIKTTALVIAKNDARADLVSFASELAKRVDGMTSLTNEQRARLGLSVRKARAPMSPPGTAYRFVLTLPGNGDVSLKWKCNNPRGAVGTMYHVYRRINDEREYTFLGSDGVKHFTDTTLPEGATHVSYRVQAVRSTAKGEWATFVVRFGRRLSSTPAATSDDTQTRRAA